MNKCTQLLPFVQDLFDDPGECQEGHQNNDGDHESPFAASE